MLNDYSKSFIKKLKTFIKNNVSDDLIKDIVYMNNELLVKVNKCKVCNKKYNSNNKFYGSSCTRNLYHNADITYSKDIENKELFLHSAIILCLGKENLTEKEMSYVTESYLSLLYFEKLEYPKSKIIENSLNKCIEKNKKPIMKLNTAYRITNILKRNSELFTYDESKDVFVDKSILSFFKTYFSISKISMPKYHEICYYIQVLFWEFIVSYGKQHNLNFSARCLKNSITIDSKPKNIIISNNDKTLINEIKNEYEFREKVKYIIKKYSKENNIIFNKNIANEDRDLHYEFTTTDLAYSIHNVTINLDGKGQNNKWNLNITLIDTYDFTEILSNNIFINTKNKKDEKEKYITKAKVANDLAAISSQYGVIKPFDITIKFKWVIMDD